MTTLQYRVANSAMPRKRYIHDCVDTGADFALLDGVAVLFPCDCVGRNYRSDDLSMWDNTTHTISDSIDNAVINAEFNMTVNGGVNTVVEMYFYIDNPTLGIIPIKRIRKLITKNNVDDQLNFNTILYNGVDSEAKDYGFKVSIEAQGGSVTLKARSILTVTG